MSQAGAWVDAGTAEIGKRSPVSARNYYPLFDLLRFIAAIGIIWTHATLDVPSPQAHDASWLAGFAVPFFTCGAVFFAITSVARKPSRGFGPYLGSRFVRLYLPFLAWSALYLAVKHGKYDASHLRLGWRVLLDGGAYHLWFLPYILILTLAAFPLAWLVARADWAIWIGVAAGTAGVFVAVVPSPVRSMAGRIDLIYLGWKVLPAALWGVPLAAIALSPGTAAILHRPSTGAAGIILAIGSTAALLFTGPLVLLQNLAGFGLVLLGLCSQDDAANHPAFARLGKWAMGVYLLHVFFIGLCRTFATHHGGSATIRFAIWASAVSLLGSVIGTLLLQRVKWLRWLVGM